MKVDLLGLLIAVIRYLNTIRINSIIRITVNTNRPNLMMMSMMNMMMVSIMNMVMMMVSMMNMMMMMMNQVVCETID